MFKKMLILIGAIGGMMMAPLAHAIEASIPGYYPLNDRYPIEVDRPTTYLDSTELDSFIVETMNTEHIPGVAACVVKDGQVIWTGTYGWAHIEDSIEVADTTVFLLASISKTVTAMALMQLWEKGFQQGPPARFKSDSGRSRH